MQFIFTTRWNFLPGGIFDTCSSRILHRTSNTFPLYPGTISYIFMETL